MVHTKVQALEKAVGPEHRLWLLPVVRTAVESHSEILRQASLLIWLSALSVLEVGLVSLFSFSFLFLFSRVFFRFVFFFYVFFVFFGRS